MGNIETSVLMEKIQVPIDKFKNILPKENHLDKLKKIPDLSSLANRRLIQLDIENQKLVGYIITDFYESCKCGDNYISVEDLETKY